MPDDPAPTMHTRLSMTPLTAATSPPRRRTVPPACQNLLQIGRGARPSRLPYSAGHAVPESSLEDAGPDVAVAVRGHRDRPRGPAVGAVRRGRRGLPGGQPAHLPRAARRPAAPGRA